MIVSDKRAIGMQACIAIMNTLINPCYLPGIVADSKLTKNIDYLF